MEALPALAGVIGAWIQVATVNKCIHANAVHALVSRAGIVVITGHQYILANAILAKIIGAGDSVIAIDERVLAHAIDAGIHCAWIAVSAIFWVMLNGAVAQTDVNGAGVAIINRNLRI